MSTGFELYAPQQRMLLNYEDLDFRGFAYLQQVNRQSVLARWDRPGVFNVKLTVAGSADNVLTIGGTSLATDGDGHILDIQNIHSREAEFENANGVTYYVGLQHARIPVGIRINSRLAVPQYYAYRDVIGVQNPPDSVVDNGDGTLSLVVNSVTESGVNNGGRTVVVWKNVVDRGAVTDAIAIEQHAVTFAEGDNSVVVGAFGQETPSTDPFDYSVVLLGARVTRTVDLREVGQCCFLATIVGNGGTPPAGNNTNQFLFKTFEDATQITYSYPSSWMVGVGNVKDALDRFSTMLNESIDGGRFVTVETNTFSRLLDLSEPMTTYAGGIGNHTDAFSGDEQASLIAVLEKVDSALRRNRVFSATISDRAVGAQLVARESDYDEIDGPNAAVTYGGAFMLRPLSNSTAKPYKITAPSASSYDVAPLVIGEQTSPVGSQISFGLDRAVVKLAREDNDQYLNPGHWMRLFLDTEDPEQAMYMNGNARAPGGIFEDVLFRGGNVDIGGMDLDRGASPVHIRNSVFDPIDGARALVASLTLGVQNPGKPAHVLIENCVFLGPLPGQLPTPSACVLLASTLGPGLGAGLPDRPITFRNCVFIGQRSDIPVLAIESASRVSFETCQFYGADNHVPPVISIGENANASFRDCYIYAPGGQCVDCRQASGAWTNCTLETGTGGVSVSDPVVARFVGSPTAALQIMNLQVFLNAAAVRSGSDANVPTKALLIFGQLASGLAAGNILLDGLTVTYGAAVDGLHAADTVALYGTNRQASYSNITIDCTHKTRLIAGVPYNSGSGSDFAGIVTITGGAPIGGMTDRVFVRNLKVVDYELPNLAGGSVIAIDSAVVESVVTRMTVSGIAADRASYAGFANAVYIRDDSTLNDYVNIDDVLFYGAAALVVGGDRNRICGFRHQLGLPLEHGDLLKVSGNRNDVSGFWIAPSSTYLGLVTIAGLLNVIHDGSIRDFSTGSPIRLSGTQAFIHSCFIYFHGAAAAIVTSGAGKNRILNNDLDHVVGPAEITSGPVTTNLVYNNLVGGKLTNFRSSHIFDAPGGLVLDTFLGTGAAFSGTVRAKRPSHVIVNGETSVNIYDGEVFRVNVTAPASCVLENDGASDGDEVFFFTNTSHTFTIQPEGTGESWPISSLVVGLSHTGIGFYFDDGRWYAQGYTTKGAPIV